MQPKADNTPNTTPPTTSPVTSNGLSSSDEKRIKNASRSIYILGFFLAALGIIVTAYYIYKGSIISIILSIVFIVFYTILAIIGRRIGKLTDAASAKKHLALPIVLSAISAIWPIINSFLGNGNGIITIVLSIVLFIYLLVIRSRLGTS